MGWFSKKPSIKEAVEGIGTVAKDLKMVFTGKVSPDVAMEYEAKMKELDLRVAEIQTEVNKAEAATGNIFIAGWRPFIGWVCGVSVAYTFLIYPFINWVCKIYNKPIPPLTNTEQLFTLLLAMLGLGAYRSI